MRVNDSLSRRPLSGGNQPAPRGVKDPLRAIPGNKSVLLRGSDDGGPEVY